MLTISLPQKRLFNQSTQKFIHCDEAEVQLEHSLVSMSKWESEFTKVFLDTRSDAKQTPEETLYYLECMVIGAVPPHFTERLTAEQIEIINEYIGKDRTATFFGEMPKKTTKKEVVTSELIYFWMIHFNVPLACEQWHLSRLFALIQICNVKNQDPKKNQMSKAEIAARNRKLNAERRAKLGTRG